MNILNKIYEIYKNNKEISIDTRKIKDNTIFWALKGENFDGNDFVKEAMQKGCVAAVTSNRNLENEEKNIFYFEDTLKSLQEFANFHRNNLKIPIIAITGTNGKTTTKELISEVLSQKYKITHTLENLNNHIGVPLTILSIKDDSEIGIIEMGANHLGEIKTLCEIAQPTHGLITNIGRAHLEGFGSFEGIIKTKTELYDFLKKNHGIIFNNADNAILQNILNGYESVTYGKQNAFCTGKCFDNDFNVSVKWNCNDKTGYVNSNLIGNYNFENILAAITVGLFFEVSPTQIDNAISNYTPNNNRSQLSKTENNTLIEDFYNANPSSMSLAIENIIKINNPGKCLILGDMLELGKESTTEHKKILNSISKENFDKVFVVGENFYKLKNNYKFYFFEKTENLETELSNNLVKNKLILIKGSRGIHLEKIVKYL
ncbi:MAG: UDP-N-acetylmuramoyl-tripeptide--D-alanyl-D-alanine ligase [Bacteroidales bacterium]|jgi:UDP-N-acetylmuramoyl-tripeptide--D-alanyl-D-alanine ligase|nr:UDP-N-acetylmuramoyl-tripeptide--D-alanyl-D-alanine ligase [Bacteroidales bacterium]